MQNRMLYTTRFVRSATALLAVLLLLSLMSGTALAAAPSNDTFTGATAVTLGFSEVLDTTEATTDNNDAQLNDQCGWSLATDASVWYAFTVAADATVVIDVLQSSYPAGILVGTGSEGNLSIYWCGAGQVALYTTAGTTYYVLAVDTQLYEYPVVNGGLLSIAFNILPPPPPPPTLDSFTVNPFGQVDTRTGIATISGSYTCTGGNSIQGSLDARQNVGRFTISGSSYLIDRGATCDGAPHPWAADVATWSGKFAGGKLMTEARMNACNVVDCAYAYVKQTIQLRAGK